MALTLQITTTSKKAANEIKTMATKAGASVKTLEKKSVSSAKRMTTSFSKLSRVLGPLGLGAGIGGLILGIGKLTKSVAGFETAMAEVSTLVDTSVTDMGKLNDAVLDLTTKVPQNAVEISKGLYQTISAGITDVNDALFVLESASRAATAGLTDTLTAVDVGTTIINAYGKSVKDINEINDILFNTVKEGKTRFDLLASSIGRAAPIAAQAGISFEELTAATATLTKGGISTEEAMTAIRATLVQVLKPSGDAVQIAKELGLEFNSTALKAKGLSGFLEDVIDKTDGNIESITGLFGNVRALVGVLSLAGEQSEEFARILETNKNAAGAADEAFEKMNVTAENQWKLFKNQLNKQVLEFGEKVLPLATEQLIKLNEAARDNREFIDKLEDQVNDIERPFVKWLAVLKPVRTNIEEMATPLEDLITLIDGTSKAMLGLLAGPKFEDFFEIDQSRDDPIGRAIDAANELNEELETTKKLSFEVVNFQAEMAIALGKGAFAMNTVSLRTNIVKQLLSDIGTQVSLATVGINATATGTQIWKNEAEGVKFEVFEAASILNDIIQLASGARKFSLSGLLGIGAGIASLIPGGQGVALGLQAGSIATRGFQGGGSFTVPGTGSGDRPFRLNLEPGERVDVTPKNQVNNNQKVTNNFFFQIADEITIKTKVIPIINDFVTRQGGKLMASGVA